MRLSKINFMIRPAVNKLCFFLFILTSSGCNSSRNLVYFSNLKNTESYTTPIQINNELTIQADDLLDISVSSLSPESNILFNNGVLPTASGISYAAQTTRPIGYLVDKNGSINFPVLGTISLSGLSTAEATKKLTDQIRTHVKNPAVNIKFINFRITVIGEVMKPSSFIIPTERINILEALGLAGDMTVYGKRENVLLIREQDGVRTTTRIDLTNKQILSSPYFYLQQNDIVYVEPDKAKGLQASTRNYYLPIALTALSVLSILFTALK